MPANPGTPDFDPQEFAYHLWRRWRKVIVIVLPVALFVLFGIGSCFYTVPDNGRAVVKRFGQVIGVADPGLHFKLPWGIDTATFVPTQSIMKEEFGYRTTDTGRRSGFTQNQAGRNESLMLTGDLNVIDVRWAVQYRIANEINPARQPANAAAARWLHSVREPKDTIRDISEAVMRRVIGNSLSAEALTGGRKRIETEVEKEMGRVLDDYKMGVTIQAVQLQRVTQPTEAVRQAYNEVNQAEQQQEQLKNEAEEYRNKVLPQARGQAAELLAKAKAYEAERVNAAKGESSRFTSVLQEYRKAEDVTRQRMYLEMIDKVMPRIGQVYVVDPQQQGPLPLLNMKGPAALKGAN
jgi:membrane protease subunit HflK